MVNTPDMNLLMISTTSIRDLLADKQSVTLPILPSPGDALWTGAKDVWWQFDIMRFNQDDSDKVANRIRNLDPFITYKSARDCTPRDIMLGSYGKGTYLLFNECDTPVANIHEATVVVIALPNSIVDLP